MIVTPHFVYIHTSRCAGTFLNKLILEQVPGAQMLRSHGHLRDLPEQYSHLPVIGIVRNPWDWYVSMFFDYRNKQQYVYQVISEGGAVSFDETISRFLNLGDDSELSKKLLSQLVNSAPTIIDALTPPRRGNPGLCSEHFAGFPANRGYYSWLFELMYATERDHDIHIGRFEKLVDEVLRLFEITETPISQGISGYLDKSKVLNTSKRPRNYAGGFPPELEQLVAEKDGHLIDKYEYRFSRSREYPKTEYYNHLGAVDVDALVERVKRIPDSQWEAENENKPNKFARLNDTCHIIFRFLNNVDDAFDFSDHPVLWAEWQDMLLPIMDAAAERLGYSNYCFPRVMLARLPAGGQISLHIDEKANHYVHKIHVPLMTNTKTIFYVGGQEKHLPAGDIVEVNNKRMHAVKNGGDEDRIHLIFECYNQKDYGKVG